MVNHSVIIGPNNFPIEALPNCCKKKSSTKIASTITAIVFVVIYANKGICFKPSTAEVMEIGGVIIPSASNAVTVLKNGNPVGTVTSGVFSPTVGHSVAMAYIDDPHNKNGSKVEIEIRANRVPAIVVPKKNLLTS